MIRISAAFLRCVPIAVVLAFAASGAGAELVVSEAYVRGLPPGQGVTAAFMTLGNAGEQDVVLSRASSPLAETVEFHQHSHEGGMMRMRPVAEITVPAGGELRFVPGGLHLMLIGLQRDLREGERVPIELCDRSERCQTIEPAVVSVLNEE